MTEPTPTPPGPPLVIPMGEEIPVVVPVAMPLERPRPGFWGAFLLTLGFGSALFGMLLAVVIVGVVGIILKDGMEALKPVPGAKDDSIAAVPQALLDVLAYSFPVGYFGGLVYAIVVCRVRIGRGWMHEVGLGRLPAAHLGLGLLALPGFIILSDVLAKFLFPLFGMADFLDQSGDLGVLFKPFHWSFAVLAVGIGPGIVEELWCLAFLGRGLIGRYGWAWGVLLTSLFFGCLHVYPPPYVLVTAAMGACLHFTYIVSRSLWVPITIHMLNNSFAALLSVGAIPAEGIDRAMTDQPVTIGFLSFILLLSAGFAMWTARARVVGGTTHAGVMVPPADAQAEVKDRLPHPLVAAAAVGCSVVLVWLLRG